MLNNMTLVMIYGEVLADIEERDLFNPTDYFRMRQDDIFSEIMYEYTTKMGYTLQDMIDLAKENRERGDEAIIDEISLCFYNQMTEEERMEYVMKLYATQGEDDMEF